MESPPILDFESLLRPFEGDNPAGEDIRNDPSPTSTYYEIKDARAAARAAERSGDPVESGQHGLLPEWRRVLQLGPQILASKAKDLEVAAWLTEALVREYGFTGLRDGIRLSLKLVQDFWDGLYPMPDEDGISTRVAPLAGLNGGEAEGTLSVPLALAPITEPGDGGAFGMWRYSKARELERSEDPNFINDAIAHGAGTMEQFEAAVRMTSPDFFKGLTADIDAALREFAELSALLDEKCGTDSPPSSNIRNTLTEAKQTLAHVVREVAGLALEEPEPEPEGDESAQSDDSEAQSSGGAARKSASGEIHTRDDAFRLLTRVAEYFRVTEPHSPLSSLLSQAVRWGRMPLDQLIEELIPDSSARDHFGLLTGIRTGRSDTDDDDD